MTDRGAARDRHRPDGQQHRRHRPGRDRSQGRAESRQHLQRRSGTTTFANTYANGVKMIGTTDEPRGHQVRGRRRLDLRRDPRRGSSTASKPEILKEKIGENEINLGRTTLPDGNDTNGHRKQFLECVKSRQQPFAHAEVGHRTSSICHLNNIAMAGRAQAEVGPGEGAVRRRRRGEQAAEARRCAARGVDCKD